MIVKLFFLDGEPPETTECRAEALSERWLNVCRALIRDFGPVFSRNLGSTLSHFDIHMAGPMGELSADGRRTFRFAISTGVQSRQDLDAVAQFQSIYRASCEFAKQPVASESIAAIDSSQSEMTLLLLDLLSSTESEDKAPLAQLGIHLAAAYLEYCAEKEG